MGRISHLPFLKGVEAGGAVGSDAPALIQLTDQSLCEDPFAKVTLIDRPLQDDLIDALQLGEGKLGGEELIPDRRPFDLVAQPPDGILKDPLVVKGEAGTKTWIEDGVPGGIGCVRSGVNALPVRVDEGEVGDADDAPSRIPPRFSEGVELLEVDLGYADLLTQFAGGGLVERFIDLDEAPGQCPLAEKGLRSPTNQENLQGIFRDREDDQIDGHGGFGIGFLTTHLASVVSGEASSARISPVVVHKMPACSHSVMVRAVLSSATPPIASATTRTFAPALTSPRTQARTQ